VDPLLALRPLTAHVKHAKVHSLEQEVDLANARGFDATAQNVLGGRHKVLFADGRHFVQEVFGRVVELVLGASV